MVEVLFQTFSPIIDHILKLKDFSNEVGEIGELVKILEKKPLRKWLTFQKYYT